MMTKTDIREFRNRFEADWALPPGCRAKTIAMCCEKCVYDSGKHTCALKKKVSAIRLPKPKKAKKKKEFCGRCWYGLGDHTCTALQRAGSQSEGRTPPQYSRSLHQGCLPGRTR